MHSLLHNKHFIFVLYKYNANIIFIIIIIVFVLLFNRTSKRHLMKFVQIYNMLLICIN